MGDLYDELGVSPAATPGQLRRAYRARARELHPDLNPGPDAQEAIRRLNQAWEVLGDQDRRRRYDARLAERRSLGAPPVPAPLQAEPRLPLAGRIVRPSIVAVAVLGVIFVVTAYAGPHSKRTAPVRSAPSSSIPDPNQAPGATQAVTSSYVGKCLLVQPGYDAVTPCSQPNNGQVVAEVSELSQCPAGTAGYQLIGRAQLVCLAPR